MKPQYLPPDRMQAIDLTGQLPSLKHSLTPASKLFTPSPELYNPPPRDDDPGLWPWRMVAGFVILNAAIVAGYWFTR